MSAIFTAFGIVQLILLGLSLQIWSKSRRVVYLILSLITAALAVDNVVIGLGRTIGEGSVLEFLNSGRFVTHAFLTPLLAVYGLRISRNAGIGWAWEKAQTAAIIILAVALIGLGVYTDVFNLNLEAVAEFGTLRYVNTASHGPPIPAIITIIVLILMGFSTMRVTRWPWLLVGALLMFIFSAAAPSSLIAGNFGEIMLLGSLSATGLRFPHQVNREAAMAQEITAETVQGLN